MNTPATVAEADLRRSLPLFVYGTLRRGEGGEGRKSRNAEQEEGRDAAEVHGCVP